ncbi:hypothetical protein [Streptomyces sedi]|uniref:Uncharacterized protein n=1 Tax=Streptomyces sedi TaxID=555059 RepID=A0A5C4UJ14_9ACTN|nr:hypothetical protein [Streptomyces sedi]TNM23638.1 hypothetical protein FH715_27785 [Streptomyces sedi]
MSRPTPPHPPVPPTPPGGPGEPAGPADAAPPWRRWWLVVLSCALGAVVVAVLVLATRDDDADPKREACDYYTERMQELAEATDDRDVHAERIDGWARGADDAEFREAGAELLAVAQEGDRDAWLNGLIDFGIACYGLPEGPTPSP